MFDLSVACSLVGPARQQQQQPWQTVLTPRGDRMPSPGILTAFLVGKHCPRNWYTSLCPRIWGQKSGLLRKMQAGGCGAPLTHGAGSSCVHCHWSRICAGGFVSLSASCKAHRAGCQLLGAGLSCTPIAQLSPPTSLPHLCLSTDPGSDRARGCAELAVAGGHELALSSAPRCFLWSSAQGAESGQSPA